MKPIIRYSINLRASQIDTLSWLLSKERLSIPMREDYEKENSEDELFGTHVMVAPHKLGKFRGLYGLIGIHHRLTRNNRYSYEYFFIPVQNKSTLDTAMRCRIFSKQIRRQDLAALRAVYNKDEELRAKWSHWHPRFSVTEVAKATGIPKKHARESLDRLVGILCFMSEYCKLGVGPGDWEFGPETRYLTVPFWMLPAARHDLAHDLLFLDATKQTRSYSIEYV